jgi:peptidoglycan/LPS O-acetylase OafA/YrhL
VFVYPGYNFKGRGTWGIYLFFVLSAFLLTWHYLETPARVANSLRYWRGYAGRRLVRIYPLYTVALLLTMVSPLVSLALAGKEEPSIWRHLLLLDGYKIFWTIPVEMKMYAVLPFLLTALHAITREKTSTSLLSLLALFVILLAVSWAWPPSPITYRSVALHDFLAPFFAGFMAAFAWKDLCRRSPSLPVRVGWDLAGVLALVAILAPWLVGDPFGPGHRLALAVIGTDAAWYGAAWGIVLLSTLAGRGLLQRLFEFRPLRVLGVVSFSAYIWHMPVLEFLRRTSFANRGEALSFPIIFTAMVIVAIASFVLVERPSLEAFARWSRRGREQPAR